MLSRPFLFLLMAAVAVASARAQNGAAPPAPTVPIVSAQDLIAAADLQWRAAFKREVTDVHESEVEKAKLQYAATLEAGMAKAGAAGDLEGALALRNEQRRFSGRHEIPREDAAADAASVKQMRTVVRTQLARLEGDRAARAKALQLKFDEVLAQVQVQLTQRGRFDEALLVRTRRGEIAKEWLGEAGSSGATTAAAEPPQSLSPARQLEKALANTTWEYRHRENEPDPAVTVTIYPDNTLAWSDRPAYHVPFQALDALSLQVRDHLWKFAPDLQSFTIHDNRDAPADRWGKRINPK